MTQFQIQILRGAIESVWWETITSSEIKSRGSGFKTNDDAWAYIQKQMADIKPHHLRVIPVDPPVSMPTEDVACVLCKGMQPHGMAEELGYPPEHPATKDLPFCSHCLDALRWVVMREAVSR